MQYVSLPSFVALNRRQDYSLGHGAGLFGNEAKHGVRRVDLGRGRLAKGGYPKGPGAGRGFNLNLGLVVGAVLAARGKILSLRPSPL
jgi:hypothetical protein